MGQQTTSSGQKRSSIYIRIQVHPELGGNPEHLRCHGTIKLSLVYCRITTAIRLYNVKYCSQPGIRAYVFSLSFHLLIAVCFTAVTPLSAAGPEDDLPGIKMKFSWPHAGVTYREPRRYASIVSQKGPGDKNKVSEAFFSSSDMPRAGSDGRTTTTPCS